MEITDPYERSKFTTEAPGPEKPFVSGKNLTNLYRDGEIDCRSQMSKLATSSKTGSQATEKDTSQLLWAARGRTPHYIKTDRWKFFSGLTIPMWAASRTAQVSIWKKQEVIQLRELDKRILTDEQGFW
jgi:hypothetical protein